MRKKLLFTALVGTTVLLMKFLNIETTPMLLFPLISFGSSKSKPRYMPGQQQGYQDLLGMAMSSLGATGGAPSYNTYGGGLFGGLFSGILNNLFGLKKQQQTAPVPNVFDRMAQPYQGQLSAPTTDNERWALEQMRSVIEGGYDPRTSDFYQGMRESMLDDISRAKTAVRQSASLGGMLASTPRIGQESEIERQGMRDMSTLLGSMYETERDRIQQTLPLYAQQASVEREVQQLGLDKEYDEFLRQLQAMGIPLNVAMNLLTMTPGKSSSQMDFGIT